MTDGTDDPSRWRIAVPAFSPLLVAYGGMLTVMLVRDDWQQIALFLLCVVLLANAAWLTRALFRRVTDLRPFLLGIACVLCVWLWQWRAFSVLVPNGDLRYGYFLTPEGATAHRWLLVVPYWTGTALLGLACGAAIWWWWRQGIRLKVLWTVPWWLGLFLVFALPSAYFDAQGNASVFI